MKKFKTAGVCAKEIEFKVEEGCLRNVRFAGGCPGNLEAISILLEGMAVETAVAKLEGITCGLKTTSCADQLTIALKGLAEGSLAVEESASLPMA